MLILVFVSTLVPLGNIIPSLRNDTTKSLQTDLYAMKNDLYAGSGSSSAGSSSSAASSSSMQTSLLPGGAAGNSLSALSGAGGKGSLAIGKSIFFTERPPNEYASSLGKLAQLINLTKFLYKYVYKNLFVLHSVWPQLELWLSIG